MMVKNNELFWSAICIIIVIGLVVFALTEGI